MVSNALRAGYKRNDEWFGKDGIHSNPERHAWWKKLIKRVDGNVDKINETFDFDEDWKWEFVDYWFDFEVNKERLSPEQAKALKEEAARQALPRSMKGEVQVPHELRPNLDYDKPEAGKTMWIITNRYSGQAPRFSSRNATKLISANQLADYQDKTGNNVGAVTFVRFQGTRLSAPDFKRNFTLSVKALTEQNFKINFFLIGLEGALGQVSAWRSLHEHLFPLHSTATTSRECKVFIACQPIETSPRAAIGTWPADHGYPEDDMVVITDGTETRHILEFDLHKLIEQGINPQDRKYAWLKTEWAIRVEGREMANDGNVTMDQIRGSAGLAAERQRRSRNVKRHRKYGDISGLTEEQG